MSRSPPRFTFPLWNSTDWTPPPVGQLPGGKFSGNDNVQGLGEYVESRGAGHPCFAIKVEPE